MCLLLTIWWQRKMGVLVFILLCSTLMSDGILNHMENNFLQPLMLNLYVILHLFIKLLRYWRAIFSWGFRPLMVGTYRPYMKKVNLSLKILKTSFTFQNSIFLKRLKSCNRLKFGRQQQKLLKQQYFF